MSETRSVNLRHEPYKSNRSLYVYCGRAGHGEPGPFGNPFMKDFIFNGLDAFELFDCYAEGRVRLDPAYRIAVRGLYGRNLACFCVKPDGTGKCHTRTLVRLANMLHEEEVIMKAEAKSLLGNGEL